MVRAGQVGLLNMGMLRMGPQLREGRMVCLSFARRGAHCRIYDGLRDLHGRLNFTGCTDVSHWSDSGPHFLAYKVMTGIGYHLAEQTLCDHHVTYGLESHFKIQPDQLFAQLRARRENTEAKKICLIFRT